MKISLGFTYFFNFVVAPLIKRKKGESYVIVPLIASSRFHQKSLPFEEVANEKKVPKKMGASPLAVLKARFSFPADAVVDEKSSKELEKLGYHGPKLQRLMTHRRSLITFMALFYTVAFLDRIWTITTEFKTLDDIRRCPQSAESDLMTKSVEELMSVAPAFGGSRWGKCEDHVQYRYAEKCTGEDDDEVCSDVKADSTLCVGRPNDQLALITPFSQFVKIIDDDDDVSDEAFDTTESSSVDPPVGFTVNDAFFGLSPLLVYWLGDSEVYEYPECSTNYGTLASFDHTTDEDVLITVNIKCFTNATMGGGLDTSWYIENAAEDTPVHTDTAPFTAFDTVVAYTSSTKVSTASTCGGAGGAFPTMSRPCCTSQEVLTSAKNPPELVDIRKNISIVNLALSCISMLSAWIASYKWADMRLSQIFAAASWIAPFVISCVLAMMPLAYLAQMDGEKVFNNVLTKNLDFADLDNGIKYMNALTPAEANQYGMRESIIYPMISFLDENAVFGQDVSNTAIDIEFRLKTMASALLPLALTALALPGGIAKASIQVKELFTSLAWIGWLIRLMPIFYLPWAAAIFCGLSQIYAGPFVTCAVAAFLVMKVCEVTFNGVVHTRNHESCEEYRKERSGSFLSFVIIKSLLVMTVGFFIAAVLTDDYLKKYGIKAIVGEVSNIGTETVHFLFSFIFAFLAKSANTIVMFTDLLLIMVAFIATSNPSGDDETNAVALKVVLSKEHAVAPAGATGKV